MDGTHLGDGPLRRRRRAERRGAEEVAGAVQAPEGVLAVVGVLGHARHGEGVQGLEHERPDPADEHGRVPVHLPDCAARTEEPHVAVGAGQV
jgi:hypothetical protein